MGEEGERLGGAVHGVRVADEVAEGVGEGGQPKGLLHRQLMLFHGCDGSVEDVHGG